MMLKKASNYSHMKNHSKLHDLIKKILEVEEEKFLDIINILFHCDKRKDIDDYFKHYVKVRENRGDCGFTDMSILYSLYKGNDDLSNLRGRFVELLVYYLLDDYGKYSKEYLDMRCYLGIDGELSEKEVDVFGWDKQNKEGEFYECKVNCENVADDEFEDYLYNLVNVNILLGGDNFYGVISLNERETLKEILKENLEMMKGYNDMKVFGRIDLHISNFRNRFSNIK